MGIFSQFGIFSSDDVDIRSQVESDSPNALRKVFRGLNALREHILDVAPVGITQRDFKGHDHADSGPPISRACVYCEDNGNVPLWAVKPAAAQVYIRIDQEANGVGLIPFLRSDQVLATGFTSMKVPLEAKLSGSLHYATHKGAFKLKIIELLSNTELVIDLPDHDKDIQREVSFEVGFQPGAWSEYIVYAMAQSYDPKDPSVLVIYSLSLTETVGLTTPQNEAAI